MNKDIACVMIASIASELKNKRHVAVGASSPLPAAAALLAKRHNPAMRLSILGSEEDNPFTDGGRELFDCAAQGRIDTFFFSGVQIDQFGNVNLLGIGKLPQLKKRFVGNFGAPYLAGLVPNIILFRIDHSPKALVEAVDFISAPGSNVRLLVTNLAMFQKAGPRFELAAIHEGISFDHVQAATGFTCHPVAATTPKMTDQDHAHLFKSILPRMQRLYPAFVEMMNSP